MFSFLKYLSPAPKTASGGGPSNPNPEEDKGLNILARVMVGGLIVILIVSVFTWKEKGQSNAFWPVLGLSAIISLVSSAVGGLLGFLFGIPLSRQVGTATNTVDPATGPSHSMEEKVNTQMATNAYGNNTNLEQISDWLTKIIVGVSLTQLPKLQVYFRQISDQFAAGLAKYMGQVYAVPYTSSLLIFYAIVGFLFVYLWAKIYLKAQLLLTDRDLGKIIYSVKEVVQREVTSQVKTVDHKGDIDRLQQKIEQFNRQRTKISTEEEKPEIKPIIDKAKPGPASVLNDAQKNRWGGQSTVGGFTLDASFVAAEKETPVERETGDTFYYVTLTVRPLNPGGVLAGTIYFFLHDSYNSRMIQHVNAINNLASIRVGSYEAFTLGAYVDNQNVKLELDLNTVVNAPEEYKYPEKLLTIEELRLELERLKQEESPAKA